VHASGTPWDDPSGDRLRHWLGIDKDKFYDQSKIAIVPVGFCYPGRLPKGGDRPPRPECAPLWHPPLMRLLLNVELTILAGTYAQKQFLGKRRGKSLTETVQAWRIYGPDFIPLPHPSWRTVGWQKSNPWFDSEVLPDLRRRVGRLVR
jgi:uracil-DNA glycosylase